MLVPLGLSDLHCVHSGLHHRGLRFFIRPVDYHEELVGFNHTWVGTESSYRSNQRRRRWERLAREERDGKTRVGFTIYR